MAKTKAATKSRRAAKFSRTRKPDEMSLEAWQAALRKEFGREQKFKWKNLGKEKAFSEFAVTNPQTRRTYRVAIRGKSPGDNYCSCPDFGVNTLGTCKHVEFVLGRLERDRASREALARGFRPPYSEIFLRHGAKREVAFRPGGECTVRLANLASRYFKNGILAPEHFADFAAFLKKASAMAQADHHELRCYDDALSFIASMRDQERLKAAVDQAFPKGVDSPLFDRLLKTQLYPYQRQGALFAARAGRCLLADDMGLGKTVQAIAAAEILARTAGIQRVLIICPTSLKHQWKSEIEHFAGRSAEVVEGGLITRASKYATETFFKIVNYDVIHRDLEAIGRWEPDLVVLDEAQRIKNWKTRAARAVKRIASPYAIVLTGTPLENRLEEVHSIVEFVDRFRLGPMFRFLHEHQHTDEHGRVVGYKDLGHISRTLAPILLRRTKTEVLKQLPERLDKTLFVPMTPEQWAHHEENGEIVARIVSKWRRYGFLSDADQRRLMIALQNMRMSCNSTYLLDGKTDFGTKADELARSLEEAFENPEAKAVIFSQWLRTHELLEERFRKRRWAHVLFHGGVPGPKRKDLIQTFRDDPKCRLFLSTDAGGVGLNLQQAQIVVNVDQPWNPAILEQRIGRVHRFGQKKPVRVLNLVSQGTIEHGMLSLLSFKRGLFAGVLDGGNDEIFLGGSRLKRFMESVEKASGAIPAAMPASVAEEGGANGRSTDQMTEAEAEAEAAHTTRPDHRVTSISPDADRAEMPSVLRPPASESATANPMTAVMTAGAAFLDTLLRAVAPGVTNPSAGGTSSSPQALSANSFVGTDELTGKPCIKLPLPPPEVLAKLAEVLAAWGGRR